MLIDEMLDENVVLKKRISFMEDLLKVWKEEDKVRESKYFKGVELKKVKKRPNVVT